MSDSLSEKEFLIGLALQQFNSQYRKKFKVQDCDIISIPANSYSDRGYEISTARMDDLVRMRIYLKFDTIFQTSPYRLESTDPFIKGALGDEVYVSDMKIHSYYIEQGIYKFRQLTPDWGKMPILLTEDGIPLLSEEGYYLIPELLPVFELP